MSAGLDARPTATTFDVETLVGMAWKGQIRVPHFQRTFRWGREDVRRLFESIIKGYPVGSLLLWVREAPEQRLHLGSLVINAPTMDKALWVVDGQQRITSLASTLHESSQRDEAFAFAYNLDTRTFVSPPVTEQPGIIPLPVLFDLHAILKWFAKYPEISGHLDHATMITRSLRQFQIPAYQVESSDVTVLQDIYDRMNSYGKKLTRAEVFSALYPLAGKEPDDSMSIGMIADNIDGESNFGMIDADTVLLAILARRGPDITRQIRGEFNDESKTGQIEFPGESQREAYRAGEKALLEAARFLQQEVGVPHFTFLAYRYLLVVLARLFAHHPDPDVRTRQLIRRWYWRAAVVGPYIFRGSSTGAMKALTYKIDPGSLSRSVQALLKAVERADHPWPDAGRFKTNEGAGRITMCSWWNLGPRELMTGEPIEQAELARCIRDSPTPANAVDYLLPSRSVPVPKRRWASNRILTSASEGPGATDLDVLGRRPLDMTDATWEALLASNLFTPELAAMYGEGSAGRFLDERQKLVQLHLHSFLERMCEWDFEDTPSLKELVIDDLDERSDDDILF